MFFKVMNSKYTPLKRVLKGSLVFMQHFKLVVSFFDVTNSWELLFSGNQENWYQTSNG